MKILIKQVKVERKTQNIKRVRKGFGDLSGLAGSIQKHGLLHPIVVDDYLNSENEENFKYLLIAGERRLRACILAGFVDIDATLIKSLDDNQRKEIELEENVCREDFTWQERCEALRQLDELKREKFGGATQSRDSKGWGLTETADIVGLSLGAVSQDIKLAHDLKNNPNLLKKVKNLSKAAARRVINRSLKAQMLARQVKDRKIIPNVKLLFGSCEDLIDTLKDNSVHLLLTDPPFASEGIVKRAEGSNQMSYNIDSGNVGTDKNMSQVYRELVPKLFKKLVKGAQLYIFFGHGFYTELIGVLRENGFIIDDTPLIWHKRRVSSPPTDHHYLPSYEGILFGYKPPQLRTLRKAVPNVLSISADAPQVRVHGLQKPLELLNLLIDNSTDVGEVVLDCFAGSGRTLIAAKKLGRTAIGMEKNKDNYEIAQEFIEEELRNGKI